MLELACTRPRWVERLVRLAEHGAACGDHRARSFADPSRADCCWAPKERALQPPQSLLEYLIRNLKAPASGKWGSARAAEHRQRLAQRDPETIEKALAALQRSATGRGWHILEGQSYPDGYIETDDYIVVIEGKRTEPGATASTTWLEGRQQMWRHIDAAWELRRGRHVVGLMVVEGPADGSLPEEWRTAAVKLLDDSVLHDSMPHRSDDVRREIACSFAGVVTWQRVAKEFGADAALLPQTVDDVDGWRAAHGIGRAEGG